MVGIDFITNPDYSICGAASDSLVTVLVISGTVTLMALVFGIVLGSMGDGQEHGFFRKKPLILPSFAFVISVVLVISLYPIPMAQYHGLNEVQLEYYNADTTNLRVYDGIAYQSSVDILAVCPLEAGESTVFHLDFKQNDTIVESISIVVNATSPSQGNQATGETFVQIQPGLYEVEISYTSPTVGYYTVTVTQRLASGFFDEVLEWDTYTFMLTVVSFFFILGGICVAREDRTRISQEEIDQEPPRDAYDYYKKL